MTELAFADASAPPLFARLRSEQGDERIFLAEPNGVAALSARIRWQCEVVSPGGREARGLIPTRENATDTSDYDLIAALYKEHDLAKLWYSASTLRPSDVASDILNAAHFSIWDEKKRIPTPEGAGFLLYQDHPYWMVQNNVPAEAKYLEASDASGRSLFARLRPSDLLTFDCAYVADKPSFVPRVVSSPGLHTAYWGFLRQHRVEAAMKVAERLVAALTSDEGSDDAVLATSHAIVRFRILRPAMEGASRRLALLKNSVDARVMKWVFDFESKRGQDSVSHDLVDVLRLVETEQVIFAETLSLLYERLEPAAADASRVLGSSTDFAEFVSFVDRLAASSYFSGEHLFYNGHSPHLPDPDAKASSDTAQKKSLVDAIRQILINRQVAATFRRSPEAMGETAPVAPKVAADAKPPIRHPERPTQPARAAPRPAERQPARVRQAVPVEQERRSVRRAASIDRVQTVPSYAVAGPADVAVPIGYKPRMRLHYEEVVRQQMIEEFGYRNPLEVPAIEKIVLNMGVGEAVNDTKKVTLAAADLALIAGQRPVITRARNAISTFKVRENMPIGAKVTLRKVRMYEFLDRLITIALPRVRDFRGLNVKSFDGRGNFAMGIKEHIVFPEINYDKVDSILGMDIIVCTSAKTDNEARSLLRAFNFPFSTTYQSAASDHPTQMRMVG